MVCEVLCDFLRHQGFECAPCESGQGALQRLTEQRFDLVLSDINMPGLSGMELLVEAQRQNPDLVFLMVTAVNDAHLAVDALRAGALDYLVKPLELKKVAASVRNALAQKKARAAAELHSQELESLLAEKNRQLGQTMLQLQRASAETVQAMAIALDVRASEVAGHSLRVSRYAVELARKLGYNPEELERIGHAAWLHDIGKLGIPDAILNKPGQLTPEETAIMRSHVRIGYELVRRVPALASAAELVLAHQERFDGSGYPRALAGSNIPRDARVFAVADALDAITSDRPYRRASSWNKALEEITSQSGRQFDPEVVNAFLQIPVERWQTLQRESVEAAPPALRAVH